MSDQAKTKSAIAAIAEELVGAERLRTALDAFAEIDRDGDGRIELDDALTVLLERERKRLSALFERYDTNKDGFVELDEFLLATIPGIHIIRKFREFDSDKDGFLTQDEVIRLAEALVLPIAGQPLQRVIEKADRDRDGKLSYFEFYGAVSQYGFQ